MSEQGADAKPAGGTDAKPGAGADAPLPEAPASTPPGDAPPAAPAAAGQGGADRTLFARAQELLAKGVARPDILAQLKAQGVDEESAKVVLNSLPGAPMPSRLPEASLELGINPLAPKTVALSDLGLQGEPRVVGVYWIAFGVVLILLAGLALLANEAQLTGETAGLTSVATRVGIGLGFCAVAYGLFRVVRR